MTCSLLCFFSSSLWFPSLCSSMNAFLFVSLPNIKALILSPKCLFIVCNIIVAFLIGESKLVGKWKPSPDTELYDEYIKRSRNQQTITSTTQVVQREMEVKKLEVSSINDEEVNAIAESVTDIEVKKTAEKQQEEQEQEEMLAFDDYEEEEEEEEEVEEKGLAQEELTKRVEDFIARMNKQRRLEAGSLVCCY